MGMDTSGLRFPKHLPAAMVAKAKANAENKEWRRVCRAVDLRDRRVCQVTGVSVTAGAVDPWAALERHHLEPRSANKSRRFTSVNVWTVSRAVHQLLHAKALFVYDKRGRPAMDVREIDHVAWNRNIVAKGSEPCRLRRGLAVRDVSRD